MTYRELLALYKEGRLEEKKRREVEAEIEKQEAISDYLFEESSIPDLDELAGEDVSDTSAEREENARFVSEIQRSVRRAFFKMGIAVGTAVFALVLSVIFVLPRAVSMFYYDPTETAGENEEYEMVTNRMSLDLAVYSELFLPGHYRNQVSAVSRGYGAYDITIPQTSTFNGRFTAVSGRLERGRLILYNTNVLEPPVGNAFILPDSVKSAFLNCVDGDTGEAMGPAGTRAEALDALTDLDENEWYLAFVSLEEITAYEDFYRWFDKKELLFGDLWCAVYTEDKDGYLIASNIGFMPNPSGSCIDWNRDAYPKLSLLDMEDDWPDGADAALMQTHFISLLSYMKDHGEIVSLMQGNSAAAEYDDMIKSVEEDGLQLYGFAVAAQKEALLELGRDPAVSYIYTEVMD